MIGAPASRRLAKLTHTAALAVWLPGLATATPAQTTDKGPERPWFREVAAQAGVHFVHFNGMSGRRYYVEVVGPGVALFDYDNDGDLDLYLVQGRMLGKDLTPADAVFPPNAGEPLRGRLYRNDLKVLADGTRDLRFTDVTAASGLRDDGYGIGVTAGDYDNDGWTDLYVTQFGRNRLWHNNGDGTFTDVTDKAGVGDPALSVSAAFVDTDRDGWLDLYVVNHVKADPATHTPCTDSLGRFEYCATRMYPAVPDTLYHNRGDGTFEDVSRKAGITAAYGAGLGVVGADFNGDGWIDLYVANDGDPNQLWINDRDGTFQDEALLAGAAVNGDGMAESGMGVDAADFDDDGDEDLFMTNDLKETNTIYINNGHGWFEDRSVATGLGAPSKAFTGFGTGFFDYDNDGDLDVFVANGDVRTVPARAKAGDPYPLEQTNQLFTNLGDGRFRDDSARAGPAFRLAEVSRGAAFGDLDNDGDTDIVVANNSGPTRILVNDVGPADPWLGLRLVDRSGRDALGARVGVHLSSGRTLWRRAHSDASYASTGDPRVLVGLGNDPRVAGVEVRWPSGQVEHFEAPPLKHYSTLRQGQGREIK